MGVAGRVRTRCRCQWVQRFKFRVGTIASVQFWEFDVIFSRHRRGTGRPLLYTYFLKHASIVESAARSFAVISNLRKPEKATKAYSISAAGAQFDVGVEERPFRCQVRCWFFCAGFNETSLISAAIVDGIDTSSKRSYLVYATRIPS